MPRANIRRTMGTETHSQAGTINPAKHPRTALRQKARGARLNTRSRGRNAEAHAPAKEPSKRNGTPWTNRLINNVTNTADLDSILLRLWGKKRIL
jgi:hypothetical protein